MSGCQRWAWRTLVVLWALGPSGAQAGYLVTDLGTLPNGSQSQAFGINAVGQVAGTGNAGGFSGFAFVSQLGTGELLNLGALPGGGSSTGLALNDAGIVAGASTVADGHFHAFRGSTPGGLQDLGLFPGWTDSYATGINNALQVVGYGVTAGGFSEAFMTNAVGTITPLGTLGGSWSQAAGINNLGFVVGSSTLANGHTHAFRGGAGGLQDLGGLPGGSDTSFGMAINDAGVVVGFGGFPGTFHAFRSTPSGTLEDLQTLSGAVSSMAFDVNNLGAIVGGSATASGASHAFYFSDTTQMIDLNLYLDNPSGWTLEVATGINDRGEIAGYGVFNGAQHAFLLTPNYPPPVPEPSALVSTGLGLLGLLAFRYLRGHGRDAGRPVAD